MSKDISVVIPIYNEADNLQELIKRLKQTLEKAKLSYELIFVDDNSTDQTEKIFKTKKNDKHIVYLKKIGIKGKAYSLVQGFEKATGDNIAMIDGDLQYPPEEIPNMIKELEQAEIVIANRKSYHDSKIRKLFSRSFRLIFGKILYGLDHDIQSGLKLFKKEVIQLIKFNPTTAWTFDLEMLHMANQAGFIIKNYDIDFQKRKGGASSINVIKSTFDIGFDALKLKLKGQNPLAISPTNTQSMLGAGIRHNKKIYVTHTTLHHSESAVNTFTTWQKNLILILLTILLLGLAFKPLATLQIAIGFLSLIYFLDVVFNLYVILKSLSFSQEITSTQEEIDNLKDKELPIYSILCPLYKEAHVIPQFLEAIEKLSYPKEKLDVLLLLEEDDKESIDAVKNMDMPKYVRTIIVPDSLPKTKPKACNYGLAFAKGEYLVIFDAEDIPEPMQLKKAILGFKKADDNVICLQAKLNYYNPHQNLLTRLFTAEYSLWFDVTLTGLQSLNTTIPLGGTSNHFKTQSLKSVEGWDPFNVTEDADLGIRLFRKGYKTAIIDSITLEEANSKYGNWLRQRSRWLKGYMQTYLVHIRETLSFTKEQGRHSLIFQLIVGGKIAFVLINPILWLATISYFVLYGLVGAKIEALYPSLVFYMAVTSLVFGNFLFLYYYMIGVAKKGQWNLMKFVYLIPIYWIMISIAAGIALYQLVFKPHYWEKTVHGFHLKLKKNAVEIAKKEVEISNTPTWAFIPNLAYRKVKDNFKFDTKYLKGLFFVGALGISSVFNFIYSAILGRTLDFEDFALISLIGGILSIITVISGSLGSTMTYKAGFLIGKYNEATAFSFWGRIRKKALLISILFVLIWIAISPLLTSFFKTGNGLAFILFSPIILFILAYSSDRGFLSSRLSFTTLGLLTILEAILKLGLTIILIYTGFKHLAYISIPFSISIIFFIGWLYLVKTRSKNKEEIRVDARKFPVKFYLASLITGLSVVILLSFDVILAKHYLSAKEAGLYALAALIAKIIYFLGTFISPFIFPLVSRNEGANKDSQKILNLMLLGTLLFALPGLIGFGAFGNIIVPIFFGKKSLAIIPYLLPMCIGMVCFTLSRIYGDYYLAKKYYSFSAAALLVGFIQIILIKFFHESVSSFVYVMSFTWILYFITTYTLHVFSEKIRFNENNILAFLDLFKKTSRNENKNTKLRILIFNWRDTKHVWAGGAENYIHELAKIWVKEGNTVTKFCGNDSKNPRNEVIDGVTIYRKGGFYTVYFWAVVYYLFKFRGKYDVIIDSENGIPFFTPLYTKTPKFLLIHHVHQEVFRKSLKWPFSSLALFLEAKVMPLVYRNVQIITVSPSSKEEILKHKLTKTDPIIIYNGVNKNIYKPGIKNKNPMVLYLGRLQYYKSLHVFLVVASKILKKYPLTEFVIAGEGEQKDSLKKFAQNLGILDKIQFLGRVSEAEKIKLFQRAWVFINPSFMEGWGITTIEANACKTPVVASNVPGLKDSILDDKTGYLVSYGKYDAFKNAVLKLIKNESLREKMSTQAKLWSDNFSWEKSAQDFFKIISDNAEKVGNKNKISFIFDRIMSIFL